MKSNTNKATGNEIQRTDFLSNLRNELDKIANTHTKIYKLANEYLSQGFDPAEVEELLSIDFNAEAVKNCLESIDPNEVVTASSGKRYGFQIEDIYGRIISHAELNKVIYASSLEEAQEQAEEILISEDEEKGMERVVDVFELN